MDPKTTMRNRKEKAKSAKKSPSVEGESSGPPKAQKAEEVKKAESKLKKILTRTFFGALMIGVFAGLIYAGHLYVCLLVLLIQIELFRELVRIRYRASEDEQIPFFRTLLWGWFSVALFYSYGNFLHEFCMTHKSMVWLSPVTYYHSPITFTLYSLLLVTTVLRFRSGHYRYQMKLIVWTISTIMIIVFQTNYVAQSIFNGMFWFLFPTSLVIVNDIGAYFAGMTLGRKLIKTPFLSISPNKTWEGFIGGAFITVAFSFWFSQFLGQFQWFICPATNIGWEIHPIQNTTCDPHIVFLPKTYSFQLFPLFSHALRLVGWFPDQDGFFNISLLPV
jgi:phosphatidate cytidylyltransferase